MKIKEIDHELQLHLSFEITKLCHYIHSKSFYFEIKLTFKSEPRFLTSY